LYNNEQLTANLGAWNCEYILFRSLDVRVVKALPYWCNIATQKGSPEVLTDSPTVTFLFGIQEG